jgi:hypothetical protein
VSVPPSTVSQPPPVSAPPMHTQCSHTHTHTFTPTTREEKRILGSHMCQALLEKIKYDLLIARGNESFDVRYNLDVAHAADLPINSLVGLGGGGICVACVSFLGGGGACGGERGDLCGCMCIHTLTHTYTHTHTHTLTHPQKHTTNARVGASARGCTSQASRTCTPCSTSCASPRR